jgi:hypothetical protein
MLSWMRWLTSWFWNIVNSDGISGGGFLQWFSNNWLSLAIFLIIVGAVIDWIIWMIRWRPHWLWLRKRQIIYEEVPAKKTRPAESDDPYRSKKVDLRKAHRPADTYDSDADDFDDPFADSRQDMPAKNIEDDYDDPFAEEDDDGFSDWDSTDDPYDSEE